MAATFPQLLNIVNQPAIPLRDNYTSDELQAIANTAGFHFGFIEKGRTSLYASLIPQANHPDVVRILVGIGGSEVNHFTVWHDKAGNAPAVTVGNLLLPDLTKFNGDELRQTNLIMPEPTQFIRTDLPPRSVIHPSSLANGGPVATVTSWTSDGLFAGQSKGFLDALKVLATDAEKAAGGNPTSTAQHG
jgi:hypothetical protein